jgi:hypothetical protein
MGSLMIRCPVTGREISAGIEADDALFRSSPVFFSRSYCAFCRTEHEWFAKDAWVCEAPTMLAAVTSRQRKIARG